MKKSSLVKAFAVACLPFLPSCTTAPLENGEPYRRLTTNEIDFARTIFGNEIDYRKVKVYMSMGNSARGGVMNGIYMPRDEYESDYALHGSFSERSTFVHELTHIWQKQQGINITESAIGLFFEHGGDYSQSYDYTSAEVSSFGRLNIEQQASIVEDFYQMRYLTLQGNNTGFCNRLERYETALRPHFPEVQTPPQCR